MPAAGQLWPRHQRVVQTIPTHSQPEGVREVKTKVVEEDKEEEEASDNPVCMMIIKLYNDENILPQKWP